MPAADASEWPESGEGLVYLSARSLARLKKSADKLPLNAIKILNPMSGNHLSRFKGRGMEFDEARPYQPGDDIRNLDWRVTARSGRAHTKLFREERDRSVLFWVDFRSNMQFATRNRFKSVQAGQAAALLAWASRQQGNRLGGLLFSEQGHHEIRPRTGDRAVLHFIGLLADWSRKRSVAQTTSERERSIQGAVARLRRVTRPGSLLFLISDFRDLDGKSETHLSALAQHNDVVLIRLYDTLEQDLPPPGRYRMRNADRELQLDTSSKRQRREYRDRARHQQDHLQRLCRRNRMHLLSCATHEDVATVLREGLGGRPR